MLMQFSLRALRINTCTQINMVKYPALGIDLGTTCSCVGVWQNGRIEIIANEQGSRITPSCVAFTPHERLIGEPAVNQVVRNPKNTVFCVKRLIGRKFDEQEVQDDIKNFPFEVTKGEGDKPIIEVTHMSKPSRFAPEEISAMVLSKLKDAAKTYLGIKEDVKMEAVITIPAYFDDHQRKATMVAGEIAGLKVIRTLAEPTAAAIAYGINRTADGRKRILVYDLGGGTLDVSLLDVSGEVYKVLATSGDSHLGGEDFTGELANHWAKEFKRKFGGDPRTSEKDMRKLFRKAEAAKRTLSSMTEVQVEEMIMGEEFTTKITRAKFEGICVFHFDKCMRSVEKCLEHANTTKDSIDDIILVGGSTRMPKIQELLQDFFDGKPLNKTIHPDEAVAYGAAVQATNLANTGCQDVQEVTLIDVTPLSLGVEVKNGLMSTVIELNTPIPVKHERGYQTVTDNQTEVVFAVFQGERTRASENKYLGKLTVTGIKPAPRGEAKFTVIFELDVNGILQVSAAETTNPSNKKQITITQRDTGCLTREDIEAAKRKASEFKAKDEDFLQVCRALKDLADYAYSAKHRSHQAALHESTKEAILTEAENEIEWADDFGKDADVEEVTKRLALLKAFIEPKLTSDK